MSEFNQIVSKTSNNFKAPKFPNSSRKQILEPLSSKSKLPLFFNHVHCIDLTKLNKPGMLGAQNEMIRRMLQSNSNDYE